MSAAALTTAMMMFWVDALGREGGVPAAVFESWLGLGSGITSVPLGTGSIEVVSEGRAGVGEDDEDSEASVDEDDIEKVGGGRGVLVVDRLVDVDVEVVEVVDGGEGAPGDVVLGNVPDVELTPLVVVGSVGRAIGVIGSVGRGSSVVAIERAQSESKRTTRDPARPGGAGVGVRASPTLGKEILENCLQRGVRVQCDACVMPLHAPPPIRFYGLIILFKENLVRHVAGLGCARRWAGVRGKGGSAVHAQVLVSATHSRCAQERGYGIRASSCGGASFNRHERRTTPLKSRYAQCMPRCRHIRVRGREVAYKMTWSERRSCRQRGLSEVKNPPQACSGNPAWHQHY